MTGDRREDDPEPVLIALADPLRRSILRRLADGAASVTTLADGLPVTRQAVAKHLAVLERAGLVTGRRVGRETRYVASTAPLERTARWMDALAARWDQRLDALKRLAEREQAGDEGTPT